MAESGIYCFRHVATGRVYVGSAKSIWPRRRTHLQSLRRGKHHSIKLQRAWAKYGAQAFTFEVLEYVPDVANLIAREQRWIDRFDSAKSGFNVLPAAGSRLGLKHSAGSRAKMSAAHKGRAFTPEHIAKIAAAKRGKPLSPEHAAKARVANKGRIFSEAVRARMACGQTGRTHSPETRQKIADANRGKARSAEQKERHRRALLDGDGARRIADAVRRRWASYAPEEKARILHQRTQTRRIKALAAQT